MHPKPRRLPRPVRRQTLHGIAVGWTALRAYVFDRDGVCVAFRRDPDHVCRDRWGVPHAPGDRTKLTLDHVFPEAGGRKGKKADDDARFLVAACDAVNVGVPSRELREFERSYLAAVEKE